MPKRIRIAVFASGEGSNFEALVQASRNGVLNAEIALLLVNRPTAGALERANRLEISSVVLNPKDFPSRDQWDSAVLKTLQKERIEWVALAGFLTLIGPRTLEAYPRRIVNVHPALLPEFGGPGMYGERVHQAVIASGRKESGITIHLVDAEYDRGEILAQVRVALTEGETPAQLAAKIHHLEHQNYPKVLNDLVWGRLTKSGGSGSP